MDVDSRFTHRQLNECERFDVEVIKSIASDLCKSIEGKCPQSREKSLALTKLEECVMWATKSISVNAKL